MCWVCLLGVVTGFEESDSLGVESEAGGRYHQKLNMNKRPIANKYCEGKVKSTLKRE